MFILYAFTTYFMLILSSFFVYFLLQFAGDILKNMEYQLRNKNYYET